MRNRKRKTDMDISFTYTQMPTYIHTHKHIYIHTYIRPKIEISEIKQSKRKYKKVNYFFPFHKNKTQWEKKTEKQNKKK